MRSLAAVALCGAAAVGCATGSPMLVPTRVLPAARVELSAGTLYTAPVVSGALDSARASASTPEDQVRAAVAYGVSPPGVAPYVSARGGLGHDSEGSLALIGPVVRIGARRVLLRDADFRLVGGLNARLAFISGAHQSIASSLSIDESRLYGGEVTLQAGIARRDIYDLWLGVRTGYLYSDSRVTQPAVSASAFDVGAHRVESGLSVGMRVGFGHVAVAVELEAQLAWSTGSGGGYSGSALGFALVPAGAISYGF
ncbi:MAG: hypothetical protein R3A52_27000 [Polyangiales bacterium]